MRDPAIEKQRRSIVIKYARLLGTGNPVLCNPSNAERNGDEPRKQGPGTDGKVIYPDRAPARAAADELERLIGIPLRTYTCGRSRRGHCHLTKDQRRLKKLRQQHASL